MFSGNRNIFFLFSLFLVLPIFLMGLGFSGMETYDPALKTPTVCTLAHHTEVVILTEGRGKKEHLPVNKHKRQASSHRTIDVKMATIIGPIIQSYYNAALVTPPALPNSYDYLFFKEINPPPPKSC